MERELRASVREVTYQEGQNLWVAYETAREEEVTSGHVDEFGHADQLKGH